MTRIFFSTDMEIKVKKRNGKLEEFDVEKINKCVYRACEGIDGNNVSASEIILDAQLQLYDKIIIKLYSQREQQIQSISSQALSQV